MTDDDAPTASFAIPKPDVSGKTLVVYDRENHQSWVQSADTVEVRR